MDNIGGIVSAEYAIDLEAKSCVVIGQDIRIGFGGNKSWKEFPATPSKIEVTVIPNYENGLMCYTVSGVVFCPRCRLEKFGELIKLQYRKILLKYTTVSGDVLVAGDKSNPLKVLVENLTPTPANGYSGTKLTISGIMTHPALSLVD